MIHPAAVVHPKAHLDGSVEVGPFAVIDENVEIGPNCRIGPHVHLTGTLVAGSGNRFHTGCVIGDVPQDFRYQGEPTRVVIGDNNVFREHVTVHRSSKPDADTVIGSGNLLMAHSHIGHNVRLGNRVILANGALLGGYASVQDRAFISGNCLIHQFVRIGTLSLMQGGAAVSKDLPPYTIARGDNAICGLNTVGLRRAGFTSEQRLELKKLYQLLFRSGKNLSAALATAEREFRGDVSRVLIEFIASSQRGVCRHERRQSDSGVEP